MLAVCFSFGDPTEVGNFILVSRQRKEEKREIAKP